MDTSDAWLAKAAAARDPLYFSAIDQATGKVEGGQSLMRITAAQHCIEIGNVYWGPRIAGIRAATARMVLARVMTDNIRR